MKRIHISVKKYDHSPPCMGTGVIFLKGIISAGLGNYDIIPICDMYDRISIDLDANILKYVK